MKIPEVLPLPAGAFLMGARAEDKFATDVERPVRQVVMEAPPAMGIFPVTVAEYREFSPAHADTGRDDCPVVNVNWHEASAYCAWLTRETGGTCRLPDEEEWEYACRAGSEGAFPVGSDLPLGAANYLHDEEGRAVGLGRRSVRGEFPANAWGFRDLIGNVMEWTVDAWRPGLDPSLPIDPRRRAVRGGAWDLLPRLLRVSWRDGLPAETRRDNLGFRVAWEK